MNAIYFCPICFAVADSVCAAHRHPMVRIEPDALDEVQRKPLQDSAGRLTSRAPLWFHQLTGHAPLLSAA